MARFVKLNDGTFINANIIARIGRGSGIANRCLSIKALGPDGKMITVYEESSANPTKDASEIVAQIECSSEEAP